MTKRLLKFFRSLIKLVLPVISKILIKLKLNRRVINYLNDRSYNSINQIDYSKLIKKLMKEKKL